MSLIDSNSTDASVGSAPPFYTAGSPAAGEFRCAECGYGIAVRRILPTCPMCHGRVWDEPSWSPLGFEFR